MPHMGDLLDEEVVPCEGGSGAITRGAQRLLPQIAKLDTQ